MVKENLNNQYCKDRVVLVTGAGRGLGRAYALALAEHGAKVVVADAGVNVDGSCASATGLNSEPAQRVVAEIESAGGKAAAVCVDVSKRIGASTLIESAVNEFGQLDVVVNNAGIDRPALLIDVCDEDWDAVMNVHLRGQHLVMQAAARYWATQRREGKNVQAAVINTTSPAAMYGMRGEGVYSAAKAGVIALSKVAAEELRKYGVCVNCISPGAYTRLTAWAEGAIPGPEAVSPLIVWLASLDANDVSGRVFEAAGGMFVCSHGWQSAKPFILSQPQDIAGLAEAMRGSMSEEQDAAEVLVPGRNLPEREDDPWTDDL